MEGEKVRKSLSQPTADMPLAAKGWRLDTERGVGIAWHYTRGGARG